MVMVGKPKGLNLGTRAARRMSNLILQGFFEGPGPGIDDQVLEARR